ncbi:hypothetical protein Tdes44962_MAKER04051 [Teratosphaeria destructans]|uniref:Uncharacterized protein n=1 Tax=Teratosphaeria destructans TaxID=418781 RepID=A0A9W7W0T8_9PEZI|nr:hypothetical protein Tdes44962_MAKER04051 [Teratosphaeria destructans]
MPSADDLLGDLDDNFQETVPHPAPPEPEALPAPSSGKKSKKKSKKHAKAVPAAKWQDDEDTPDPKSVTPSPPAHGVRVHDSPPVAPAVEMEAPTFVDEAFDTAAWEDDETTAAEEPEPAPPKPESAKTSPAVRSPRPASIKPVPSSPSPRLSHVQPAQSAEQRSPNISNGVPTSQRRESFAGLQGYGQQTSPRPRYAQLPSPQARSLDPPPPHMPQSHFYGVPSLGLSLPTPEKGTPAGSKGYCCCLDTFGDAADAASAKKAKNCLLAGSEDGLEVYRVLTDKLEVVGRLEGLRGAVVGAKILPHTAKYDAMQPFRPLVAVIVHGRASDEQFENVQQEESTELYQTTVEIYSLRTQHHVANLFKSALALTDKPVLGQVPPLAPAPVGELSIDASSGFITVASGKSGEVWIFACTIPTGGDYPEFRCIGKFWTAIQERSEIARPASVGDIVAEGEKAAGVPLMSLRGRWLAVVPPYTSAGTALKAQPALVEIGVPPPGIGTTSAPVQPLVTCEVAGMDAEGTFSWLSRKAAQGLVKASQRGFEMSMQGWKELTHPSPPPGQTNHQITINYSHGQFPPTNAPAEDPKRLSKEPALVSVIDLQKLLTSEPIKLKQASVPLSTFALVDGCNYLSFSPDGLRLLTSNRKGEIATIWDLTHIGHGRHSIDGSTSNDEDMKHGPHVRQVHRIPRSSPSILVDGVWSRDGDRLALLTTHGTVHLHEIPLAAKPKKRKRRSTISVPASGKAEATVSVSQGMSPPSSNGLLGGIRAWSSTLTSQANALKTQYAIPTSFAGVRDTAAAAGYAGRRAVAKGLGQGYSAAKSGASDIWHAEDNKIRVKVLQEAAKVGCLMWVQRQSSCALAIVGGGTISLHCIERVLRRKGEVTVSGLKRDKHPKTFALLRLEGSKDAKSRGCSDQGPHGFWTLRNPEPDHPFAARKISTALAPAAPSNEVETNPPYCPFHIDRRVNIFAFNGGITGSTLGPDPTDRLKTQGHGYADEEPWMFGRPLPPSTKMSDPGHDEESLSDFDGSGDDDGLAAQVESKMILERPKAGAPEQIRVMSNRTRKSAVQGRAMEQDVDEAVEDDDGIM